MSYKFLSYALFSLLIISSCTTKNPTKPNTVLRFPTIQDSTGLIEDFLGYFDEKGNQALANYWIYYLGKRSDTLHMTRDLLHLVYSFDAYSEFNKKEKELFDKYVTYNDPDVKYIHEADVKIEFDQQKKMLHHIPVLVTNMEDKTIEIGYNNKISMVLEAKDRKGTWQDIQVPLTLGCGTGAKRMLLPPKECALVFSPILAGDFKTEIRFSIGKNKSKSFVAKIDAKCFRLN